VKNSMLVSEVLGGVSVIITTYNDSYYLPKALDSIGGQNLIPKEVIIIDDGSEDDFASEFVSGKSYPFPVFLYKKENGGTSEARNYGLAKASGEFVAFLDVDDYWSAEALSCKVDLLSQKPDNYFGSFSGFCSLDGKSKSSFMVVDGEVDPDNIGKIEFYPGGAPLYLFRRTSLVEVNGFDAGLKVNEDFDLIIRLIKQGGAMVGNNDFLYIRNYRTGSLSRGSDYRKRYTRIMQFLEKAEHHNYFTREELEERSAKSAMSCWWSAFINCDHLRWQKELLDKGLRGRFYRKSRFLPVRAYSMLLGVLL
jgi:glycosyltransferase involved in cell wall biosynthesis